MLTKKELLYVNKSVDQAPFPGVLYAREALDKLKCAIELYRKSYQGKEYDIILSNGDSITLEIRQKNLCHMLGIDYRHILEMTNNNIFTGGFLNDVALSYQIVQYIENNIEDIIKHDSTNMQRILNYFKIMIKSTILMSFSDFSSFDFGVINFDKSRYDESKYRRFNSNSTVLLFSRSNEIITPHYVMGLRTDSSSEEEKLIVETMYATSEVSNFMDNQELVVPTQILVTDSKSSELSKLVATSKEKIDILRMYQTLLAQNKVTANINIIGDYESILTDDINKLTRK